MPAWRKLRQKVARLLEMTGLFHRASSSGTARRVGKSVHEMIIPSASSRHALRQCASTCASGTRAMLANS